MDFNKLIQGLSSSGAVSGFAGGLAGSALAGAVGGKKGKKVAKGALKLGALAAVGGLAYTAYQRYQQQTGSGPAPTESHGAGALPAATRQWSDVPEDRFTAAATGAAGPGPLLLIRAMIAAAASDGHMDGKEQNRIFEEAEKLDLSPQEKATLFDALQKPLSMQQLVAQVDNPETAVEVYAASLIAIDETRLEARRYLRSLALALELPEELVASVQNQVAEAREQEAAA